MSSAVNLVHRLGVAARRPLSWVQILKFGIVGASGYVLNLAIYELLVEALDLPYALAAIAAFLLALSSNYQWNRHWTFLPVESVFIGARYVAISCASLGINLVVLLALVDSGVDSLAAQAIAVASSLPFSFFANRIWTLRQHQGQETENVR